MIGALREQRLLPGAGSEHPGARHAAGRACPKRAHEHEPPGSLRQRSRLPPEPSVPGSEERKMADDDDEWPQCIFCLCVQVCLEEGSKQDSDQDVDTMARLEDGSKPAASCGHRQAALFAPTPTRPRPIGRLGTQVTRQSTSMGKNGDLEFRSRPGVRAISHASPSGPRHWKKAVWIPSLTNFICA